VFARVLSEAVFRRTARRKTRPAAHARVQATPLKLSSVPQFITLSQRSQTRVRRCNAQSRVEIREFWNFELE
jgi:hypothetical protein